MHKINSSFKLFQGLTIICLTSCAPDSTHNQGPDHTESPTEIESGSTTLDLALPTQQLTLSDLDEEENASLLANENNELPDLFEKENNEKKMEVSAKPLLKMGDSMTDVPDVSGASMTVKMKTN